MKYKVTAFKNVSIWACVRGEVPTRLGSQIFMRPSERQEWVSLRAGEIRDDLGLVIGVHPNCIPSERPVSANGVSMVMIDWKEEALPKEFFGLFRLEIQEGTPSGSNGFR